ncbi:hypothetical protein H8D64_01255 [PVC group bacterium]|nr:hypothetical protein [PVC group bacterium]
MEKRNRKKRGFQTGNQAAKKPAEMRVDDGAYSRLNINIPRKLKARLVREANQNKQNLTETVIKKLES